MVEVSRSLRLLIADDHPAMLDGLRYMIQPEPDLEVVAEAVDGAQCVERFRDCRPDVAVIDLQMPKMDGLAVIETLRKEFNDACVIVLTSYAGDARVSRALKLGARAYLLKTSRRSEILQAIRQAPTGRTFVSAELRRELAAHHGSENLSPRELSVLRLVAVGQHNRRIGESLCVSEQTVKSRIKNILAKLQAHDRTHAVSIAVQRGFLE
jgi:DNA-binding NarL/FixJ family response regulator